MGDLGLFLSKATENSDKLSLFLELSLVLAIVLCVSFVMKLLKQPLLIGYIIAGVLVGPLVFQIVANEDVLDVFAQFGIALLLFIIGLGLNPKIIKDVGKTAALTGIAQVIFTTTIGWLIVYSLGYSPLISLYIAIALAFSSTIIILKLLYDKREHNRLYAKISVGFLLVQDICAAIILLLVTTLNTPDLSATVAWELAAWGLLAFTSLWLSAVWVLPKIKKFISTNQEFLFIFAIAWGLGFGAIFDYIGFSLEVGALAAGVALASQPYATEITSRLRPLRDFFIIMFFVHLGAGMNLSVLSDVWGQAILLSVFVLVGNPLIVMAIMGILGFTKKTGFKAGLAVAQISEFSLILITLVASHLNDDFLSDKITGLITLVALITIVASSYMIIYADKLYDFFAKFLNAFERKNIKVEQHLAPEVELLLIGYNKGGEQFLKAFEVLNKPYLIIDYNPEIVEQLERSSLPHTYGDISDLELVEELGLHKIKLIISTLSDFNINDFLADYLQKRNLKAIFICSAETPDQAQQLYQKGAAYVMLPHYIGGQKILNFIKKQGINKQAFTKFRDQHLLDLAESNILKAAQINEHNTRKQYFTPKILQKIKHRKNKNSS